MTGVSMTDELKQTLIKFVGKEIGAIAKPDIIQWAPGLPKTRSGKILRGTMKQIAKREAYDMPATIENPNALTVVTEALNSI